MLRCNGVHVANKIETMKEHYERMRRGGAEIQLRSCRKVLTVVQE